MSTVIYVAIVEGDQDRGYGAFFPDLPGCVTAAETMAELPSAARDALSLHLQGMAEDGDTFPDPTALEDIKSDPEVKEVGRILVDAEVEDAPVRVNISIGAQFLKRVDVAAEARGMSRSGFLVEAARAALEARDNPLTFAERWAQLCRSLDPGTSDPQAGQLIDQYAAYLKYVRAGEDFGVGAMDQPDALLVPTLHSTGFQASSCMASGRSLRAAVGQTVKVPGAFKLKVQRQKAGS